MLQQTLKALRHWPEHKDFVNSLVVFFHSNACRKELLAEGSIWHMEELFSSGPPLLNGGRTWLALAPALEWLSERMNVIITSWPWQRNPDVADVNVDDPFAAGNSLSGSAPDEEVSKHRNTIARSIRSAYKRAYCVIFMKQIQNFTGHIENWLRGCKCHPQDA